MRNTAVDSAGRCYQLIVSADKPFSLWLYSTDIVLTGPSGAAASAPSAGFAFQASAGQNQKFTFAVSGPGHAQ